MLFMAVHEKVKKIYDMRPKSAISTPKQSLICEHHKGRILFYLFFSPLAPNIQGHPTRI